MQIDAIRLTQRPLAPSETNAPEPSRAPAAATTQPSPDPGLSVTIQAATGLAVVQLHDQQGDVMFSSPSIHAIEAYRVSGTPLASAAQPDAAGS